MQYFKFKWSKESFTKLFVTVRVECLDLTVYIVVVLYDKTLHLSAANVNLHLKIIITAAKLIQNSVSFNMHEFPHWDPN